MTNQFNLKEVERKAFRSTYQDGLWDMYLGLIVVCMAFFLSRPEDGYGAQNILMLMVSYGLAYALFWAGKKIITLPRMGHVTFGPIRKQRKTVLTLILGILITLQVGIVLLSVLRWLAPEMGAKIIAFLGANSLERLVMAAVGALLVGPGMILIAHFNDFPRGYYIAIMMSLAVFLMLALNQPVYPIVIGMLIILPGIVLFVRFLQNYPLYREEASHE